DAWEAVFTPEVLGRHQFTVAAWSDPFDYWRYRALTFTEETPDDEVEVELQGAGILLKERLDRAKGEDRRLLDDALDRINSTAPLHDRLVVALSAELDAAMTRQHDKACEEVLRPHLELIVDPVLGRTGAWYEMFPRSEGG